MSKGQRGHRANGVFISYRRGETSGQARALHDRLGDRFGTDRVFMDVDSIDPGADFVEKIEEAIGSSAVVLVLIGRDWVSRRSGERLFDDPTDFVRMETDTALRSGVPVVPILVERAPMPEPEELPEEIRPITRRSALELENQRWEYDVNRLVHVVEQLVDAAEKHKDREHSEEREEDGDRARPKSRIRVSRTTVFAGVGVVVAAVVAVVLVLLLNPGSKSVSASAAVAAVTPDRLAAQLLEHRLGTSQIPSSVTASAPYLATYRPSGLVASVANPLTGPVSDVYVDYEVFDNRADATSYYANSRPLADDFNTTGDFPATGVADQSKCVTGSASQLSEWDWSCLTLSSTVVSFTVVNDNSDNASSDQPLAQQLVVGAVSHLLAVAQATPHGSPPAPPGTNTPVQLFNLLLSPSGMSNLLPYGLQSTPVVQSFSLGSNAPSGVVKDAYISGTLSGTKSDYHDYVSYYVFSSSHAASAWYGTDLRPSGSTPTGTSIDSSGFTQTISCGTFDKTVGTSSAVIAACVIDWGDVTVLTESWRGPTATNPLSYNETVAVTLARMAVLELGSLDAR